METLSHQLRSPHGQGPPLLTWFNLNPNMDKQLLIIYKVWDRITYPFPNFNGACRNTWWRSRGALIFSLICIWINSWVNNREAGDLRRHHAHHDVVVMIPVLTPSNFGISLLCKFLVIFLICGILHFKRVSHVSVWSIVSYQSYWSLKREVFNCHLYQLIKAET